MKDERGNLYLLTGLLLGIALGIGITRQIAPRLYLDSSPAALGEQAKKQYRAMIATAYVADGSLERARARLDLLEEPDQAALLDEQARQTLAEGGTPELARALELLADALRQGINPPEVPLPGATATVPP